MRICVTPEREPAFECDLFAFVVANEIAPDEIAEIIQAAIPGADEAVCDHVLWGMTPYPCGQISAQSLYRAASRYRRAAANGRRLCELCDNLARDGAWTCQRCDDALHPVLS